MELHFYMRKIRIYEAHSMPRSKVFRDDDFQTFSPIPMPAAPEGEAFLSDAYLGALGRGAAWRGTAERAFPGDGVRDAGDFRLSG